MKRHLRFASNFRWNLMPPARGFRPGLSAPWRFLTMKMRLYGIARRGINQRFGARPYLTLTPPSLESKSWLSFGQ
jgi:hypothetical protein